MTQLKVRHEEPLDNDSWLKKYPERHHPLLRKYGVPSWMNKHADAFNADLIDLAETGADSADFLRWADEIYNAHFGSMLADVAGIPAAQPERHVDLVPEQQVSVANNIGHVIERYRAGEVQFVAGFTVAANGDVRMFGGGHADLRVVLPAAAFLHDRGIDQMLQPSGDPLPVIHPDSAIIVPTDSAEQQRAVSKSVSRLRADARAGQLDFLLGASINKRGAIRVFAAGETDAGLVQKAMKHLQKHLAEHTRRRRAN